jgi:hypothetical protein
MPMVEVHNISDRPNTDSVPKALLVGGSKLRPGQKVMVDRSALNSKLMKLHGTTLWVGKLPPRFSRTSSSALDVRERAELAAAGDAAVAPMEHAEARAYLEGLKLSELMELAGKMSPPLTYRNEVSRPGLCARLSRAVFRPGRELDPEAFFWLRRWTKTRGGDYAPKE